MRRCELVALTAVAVLLIVSVPSNAATIRVPLHQPTIQDGIYAASEGDTVLVAPGTYAGADNRDLNFHGVNMVLLSETGALDTIVDCEGGGRGFRASSGEDSTSVVRGFTFTNGINSGILVGHAAPIIEECIISYNTGSNGGGIQYGYAETQGIVRNCIIYGNTADYRGGGIMCSHGDPPDYVAPVIRNCIVYGNEESTVNPYGGGGIFCNSCDATIVGCTVAGNTGEPGRAAVYGGNCYPVVRRTVIAFNNSGPGIYNVDADHCIIYGNPGDELPLDRDRENLAVDPLFCDRENSDFTVCDDSPCLPGDPENPWGEQIGALGAGCEPCDSAVEESTWGAIKAMYLNP